MVETKVIKMTNKIMKSGLAVSQKAKLLNSCVIPAAAYILGKLHSQALRETSLKKDTDLHELIRNIDKQLQSATTTRVSTNIPEQLGILGMDSIKLEEELKMIKKGSYIRSHPELTVIM